MSLSSWQIIKNKVMNSRHNSWEMKHFGFSAGLRGEVAEGRELCGNNNVFLVSPVFSQQPPVLLVGPAALSGPGQRGSPAAGLPADAGALGDVPWDGHAHGDVRPGNHHAVAPHQRSVSTTWPITILIPRSSIKTESRRRSIADSLVQGCRLLSLLFWAVPTRGTDVVVVVKLFVVCVDRAVLQRQWGHPEPALLCSPRRRSLRRDGGADAGPEVHF